MPPVITKDMRHEVFSTSQATSGAATAGPAKVPVLKMAVARPLSLAGNHCLTTFAAMGNEADSWAWLMLFLLLPFGLFPGFLWWYYVIRKDTYFVALSEGHVSVDLVLYRGMNERQAEEIAQTLQEVASLPRVL